MNNPLPFGGRCLTIGMLACLCLSGASFAGDSDIPRGTLTVDRNWIRVGEKSQLAWKIDYPAPVTTVVKVDSPNVIKPEKDLKMKVRVLGASLQKIKNNNGHGNNADGVDSSNTGKNKGIDLSGDLDDELKGLTASYLPLEVFWSLDGAAWTQIFYGLQNSISPGKVLLETKVKPDSKVNFGAHGWRDGAWLPIYSTAVASPNVVVLKNGDQIPSNVAALNGGTIAGYLKPYLDTVNKTVKVGERDLILMMELGETNPTMAGFDLQDLLLLVTFE